MWDEADLSCDDFLGGLLQLWQPKSGYRAGTDPVFLAASVEATSGQSVLELGCGVGTASLCLGARVEGLSLTGVEVQDTYAALARRNGLDVQTADIAALPADIRAKRFDHVLANPPFYDRSQGASATDAGREIGRGEGVPLAKWISVASKRLAPKGQLHMIQKIDRLPDIITACAGHLGSMDVLPIAARQGRLPDRMILRARKKGGGPFRLFPTLVVHEGANHTSDAPDYMPLVRRVLREGAALPFQ